MDELRRTLAEAERWHRDHPWRSRWNGVKHRAKEAWHWRRVPRWAVQRARRGYSVRDTWSFDMYISRVIGNGVRDLKRSYGHPADMTYEEWQDILDRISGPLLAYAEGAFAIDDTYEELMARYNAARDAMHLFAEHLGGMWD